jgi:hypothetical protein
MRLHRAHMLTGKHADRKGGAPDSMERDEYAERTTRREATPRCDRYGGQSSEDIDREDRGRHRSEVSGGGRTREPWRQGTQARADPGATQRDRPPSRYQALAEVSRSIRSIPLRAACRLTYPFAIAQQVTRVCLLGFNRSVIRDIQARPPTGFGSVPSRCFGGSGNS